MNANGTVGDWNLVTCDTFSGTPSQWYITNDEGMKEAVEPGVCLVSFSTDENDGPLIVLLGPDFKQVVRLRGNQKMLEDGYINIDHVEITKHGHDHDFNARAYKMFIGLKDWNACIVNTRGGSKALRLVPSGPEETQQMIEVEGF